MGTVRLISKQVIQVENLAADGEIPYKVTVNPRIVLAFSFEIFIMNKKLICFSQEHLPCGRLVDESVSLQRSQELGQGKGRYPSPKS